MIYNGSRRPPDGEALGHFLTRRFESNATFELRRAGLAEAIKPAGTGVAQYSRGRLILWAWGAVDIMWADEVVAALRRWPDALAIIVRINSQGGQQVAAEFVRKWLQLQRARTIAIIDQHCHSAATLLAAGCDLTWARRGSTWMLHRVQIAIDGDTDALSSAAFEARQTDAQVARTIAGSRGLELEVVRALRDSARFVPAEEAFELGLADRVIHALPVAVSSGAEPTLVSDDDGR